MRNTIVRVVILLAVAAVAGMGYYLAKRLPERKQEAPVFQVKRGDLILRSWVRGELRAVRSTQLTAPNLGYTSPQVTRLAPSGSLAQIKNLVVEFDDSELLATLEDAELEVEQVGENIKKAEADLQIRRNQDQVDLLRAKYAVRKAELEVKRNELISKIDARKNELTLEETKRSLAKMEEDVKSRLEQGEAELAVLREQQRKARLEVNRVKTRLAQTKLLAPMTGLVAIKENRSGGFNFGQQSPEIREGDQLSPGTPIADVLDLSELEVAARVNELERASLREGQEVLVRLDALPGKVVHGKIKLLSGTASANVFGNDPTKRFDVTFAIDMREVLNYVGATGQQIEGIMATAAENARRFQALPPPPPPMPGGPMMVAFGGPGGGPPQGGPGGFGGQEGGGGRQGGGRGLRGEGGGGGGSRGGQGGGPAGMSDEDRQKMREAFQKAMGGRDPQQMSPEERQKLFEEMRQKMGGGGVGAQRPGGGGPGEAGGRGGEPGGEQRGEQRRGAEGGRRQGGGGRGGQGGRGGSVESSLTPIPDFTEMSLRQTTGQESTQEDRDKAELPAAPEENSMMDVLLRPGLLVEAEIIVEKIPNTLFVPQQAVFEKGGKPVVYARSKEGFEPRFVKLGKRTESQVAIVEGIREGEMIALADMEAGKPAAAPKSKKDRDSGGSSQPALPGVPGRGGRP